MKICKFLLLFFAFYFSSALIYAQERLSLNLKDAPIEVAIKKIKEETGYKFFYEEDLINKEKQVSIRVTNGSIEDIVKQLLKDLQVDYIIQNKQILLKTKEIDHSQVKAQNQQSTPIVKSIMGHIVDSNGEIVPGVTVLVKETQRGVITDEEGNFSLKVEEGNTLVYSFVGLKTQESLIDNKNYYNIVLVDEIENLGEVLVVSTGYQKIPKERATGSYETISPKDIEEVPTINIMERLEGRVSGVNFDVKNNTISIRGTNSYSKSKPLIVVDGFPMPQDEYDLSEGKRFQGGADLSYLNPEDIESITVLKDAAASSIWGSRAANGVIVINTKKGKKSKDPGISFSSTLSISDKPYLDKLKQMNSAQYVDFEKEMVDLGFITDNSSYWGNKNQSDAQEPMFMYQRGESTEEQMNTTLDQLSSRDNTAQIKDNLLRKAVTQQYNLSIHGGTDQSTFFISGNYSKDQAVMKSNEAESYNFTANNTMNLFKGKVKLSTGINYLSSKYVTNNTVQNALSTVSDVGLRPYDMIVDEDGNSINKYVRFRPEVIQDFENKGYKDWTYNYINELNYSNVTNNNNMITLRGKLSSDVTPWLNASVSGMYLKIMGEQHALNERESYSTRDRINYATYYNESTGELSYGIPKDGAIYDLGSSKNENYSLRGQLNFNKTIHNKHSINAAAIAEIREEKQSSYTKYFFGYDEDTNSGKSVNPTEYYTTVYGWDEYIGALNNVYNKDRNRFLSYVGTGTYSYQGTYFLSASIRFDDYNMLGASRKDRAIPLWSLGGRWKILNESFIHTPDFLSNLDLRVTYGVGGSSPVGGSGNSNATINLSTDYQTSLPVASVSTPANSKLKWETTEVFNVGLDYGLFNSRLMGSVEYYRKNSYDILTSIPFNATYGYSFLNYNAGTLKGHGFDFDISAKILDGEFKWTSMLNVSYTTNEVTHSYFEATNVSDYFSSLIKGKPMNALYAYKWAGLDNQGRSQIYDESGEVISADVYPSDVDPKSLKYMGTTTAPYFGGFTNTFGWKNIELNTNMTFYFGHVFSKPYLSNYPSYSGVYYGAIGKNEDIASRWRKEGDENLTNVPGIQNVNYNSIDRYNHADINVLPADNIRLNQLSIGYHLPAQWLAKTTFKNVSFAFVARNLGIIWRKNKDGYDPQYLSTANYNTLMPSRNYSIRIAANL